MAEIQESESVYPFTPKFTQKSRNNTPQYPIPDSYIVETEVSERSLKCETKYISNSKMRYTITWKEGHAEWSVSSTKLSIAVVNTFLQKINQKLSTKLSGPRLFGFDIEPLYHTRLQIGSQPRLNNFGKDLQKAIDELTIKHKLTNLFGESIVNIHHIELDYKENQACIKFKDSNFTLKQDLMLLYINKINELMNIQINIEIFNIDKEINDQFSIDSSEYTSDILVNNSEIGNGAFRSLSAILKVQKPVWKTRKNPVIIPGDTLFIKLGGDGRNIGRKQNHVMVTFCLLNEGDDVLKPDHQFRKIMKYIGKENYEVLAKVGKLFASQLADLKENGIIDNDGIHWSVEFYFSGDWKFTYLIMGQNALNSEYFCDTLFIKLGGDGRNIGRKQNHVMVTFCLLNEGDDVLKPDHQFRKIMKYIGKENYEVLAKVGKLFASQLADLKENGIIDNDGIHWSVEFYFSGDWKFTYLIMGQNALNSEYFCLFCECNTKSRYNMDLSCQPTIGQLNTATAIPGLYRKEDVMPYMHMFCMHIPYFMRQLKKKGLSLRLFSTSSIEKKIITRYELRWEEVKKQKPVVYDILEFENQQIFYLINGTPTKITCKNINIS
ncbi:hypothetical protein C2G38_2163990 [Gigaspora rosea]|uniref:Uncharacterized protein n=1 Tax=Gigaspora rosea TaxID=44941 RepID=A0A397W1N8_9GLOM|nr:hypothetical protein C2G38_2163990 [Gigaspora rosea]